ncbi:DUF294 nucleotidyltransferase-like domain-containing protein [Aneurinibacillus migulanus]|uniref:DUF294 nucleotidyltransferase-like domain-containing protein n=1 Tax=Aneurinibacillus migulanus TaxID=47500 RepID=UPI002E1CD4AA|nr:DUF294 nucleotidyltransferase-like domain-containing protein [Aneurinibacillus migulanus]MED4728962.1 DUF294 nucleotidyltransferase-like domain-containing protein [Aneurinibacillus migulanus]
MNSCEEIKRMLEIEVVKVAGSSLPIFEKYRTLNLLHDKLCRKAIQHAEQWMNEAGYGMPPVPYCWFELGSGGRSERTIGNDQDHGMVYGEVDSDQTNEEYTSALHKYFTLFSQRISYELKLVGYPLCSGNVMSSNQRWRHSVLEWKQVIRTWIEARGLDEIRYLLILADMRAVYGEWALCQRLKSWMYDQLYEQKDLQRRFVQHSLVHNIPLGVFYNLHYERWGEHAGKYDVKEGGYYQLVNSVRIMAIAHNLDAVETKGRLGALYQSGMLSMSDYERWLSVLACFLDVRLRHHTGLYESGREQHNYVDTKSWSRGRMREWKNMLYFLKCQQNRLAEII